MLKKLKILNGNERLYAAGIFLLTYVFFIFTLYPTVTSQDSGDFSTAVATLGISHPPGYPLFIILGKIFTLLIPFGDTAWKVNLFSAFFGAVSAVLLYLCLKTLTKKNNLSVLGALILPVGSIFWSQAIRAETYTLNTALFLGILFLLILWREHLHEFSARESQNLLLLSAFLYGLSLGNHYLMTMAAIPFLLFVILSAPRLFLDYKFLLKAAGVFVLGLCIYLYLPIRSAMHPAMNWGDPSTWQNFWDTITRKIYFSNAVDASLHLQTAGQQTAPFFSAWWFQDFFSYHVWQMFLFTVQHFAEDYFWGILLFVPFGFWWLWKKSKPYFWLFVSLFLFYSFILSKLIGLGYANKVPDTFFNDRPFYIPILSITLFLGVLGAGWAIDKIHKPWGKNILLIFLAAVFVLAVLAHFPVENQSSNYVAYDLAKLDLTLLPPNAVFIVQNNDNTLFPIFYLNMVQGQRPDVNFYIPSPIYIYNFFTDLSTVEQQNPGRRIFTDFPFTEYPNRIYHYFGPVSEITTGADLRQQAKYLKLLEQYAVRGLTNQNLDHYNNYLAGRFYLDKALAYDNVDQQQQQNLFAKAMSTAPESANIFSQLIGNYYVRKSMFAESLPYLQQAYQFYPDEYSIQFELFLANIFTDNPQGAIPYFLKLFQNNNEVFSHDYSAVKYIYSQYGAQFQSFENLVKQKYQ